VTRAAVPDAPEEAAFRAEVRAWLEANAGRRGTEDDRSSYYTSGDPSAAAEAAHVGACKAWQRRLYDAGWAGITWPKEFGGRGGRSWEQRIWNQEQSGFTVDTGIFAVGIGMAGPTLIAHGTDEQKERYLEPLLRGEEVWCQLFSEPGAGSDLAGVTTRALRDGDEWVVNGQKVWNSGAHFSDLGILLTRTDPDAPKHRGITYFVVDMRVPGIEVRPLRQITGVAHFNEVFLTDVRIPHANIVGEVNGGWAVAQTTLMHERNLIGTGGIGIGFDDLLRLARDHGVSADPVIRQRLAECFTHFELLKLLGWRAQAAVRAGKQPGPESSVIKLGVSLNTARNGDLGLAIEGATGMLTRDDADRHGLFQQMFLNQWAIRTGGGTEQIQRNVIGERVLGLPGEPRPDKTVPFKDLPKNA
jgi:alkylation response protein AidB-like acyl-CoA dehydrogenase